MADAHLSKWIRHKTPFLRSVRFLYIHIEALNICALLVKRRIHFSTKRMKKRERKYLNKTIIKTTLTMLYIFCWVKKQKKNIKNYFLWKINALISFKQIKMNLVFKLNQVENGLSDDLLWNWCQRRYFYVRKGKCLA